jgi:hypothetical protein
MNEFRLALLSDQKASSNPAALRTHLDYALTWLSDTWSLTSAVHANYIFMQLTSNKDLKTLQKLQVTFPKERLIIASSLAVKLPDIEWYLPFTKQSPCPSVTSIVNLLATISERSRRHHQTQERGVFSPLACLAGVISQSKQNNHSVVCRYGDLPELILSPKENAFYFTQNFEQLIPIAAAPKDSINTQIVNDKLFDDAVKNLQFGSRINAYASFDDSVDLMEMGIQSDAKQDLDELMWFAVLVASRGMPLETYQVNDKMRLLEMPSAILSKRFNNDYDKLAEIFLAKAVSIIEANEISQHSLYDTVNFCNACTSIGQSEFTKS